MREDRHTMSKTVREVVAAKSQEWGYRTGSVYSRKVHFRDAGMISQIEQKVVNRLRQVTSAIRQDGANKVNIIRSTADRQAAIEFAKAAAIRPKIVGDALANLSSDGEISDALFKVLETQQLLQAEGLELTMIPKGAELLAQLATAHSVGKK